MYEHYVRCTRTRVSTMNREKFSASVKTFHYTFVINSGFIDIPDIILLMIESGTQLSVFQVVLVTGGCVEYIYQRCT